jgi:hypothetical protein
VLVALVLLGCKGRSGPAAALSARPAPPPAPAGLVAELVVPGPRALYGALRSLAASRAPMLPASPELALASVLGLPPQVAGALVLDRPLVAMAVVPEGAVTPRWVGACRVKSGAELSQVLGGRTAAPGAPALGVVDDWLIIATDPKDVKSFGPYVARTLGARPPPAEALVIEVRAAALRGPATAVVRRAWTDARASLSVLAGQARESAGRPADFGDPGAILLAADERVAALLGLLESGERLRLALTLGEAWLALGLELDPSPGGAAEKAALSLPAGDLAPLLALPHGTLAGVLLRMSEADLDALGNEGDAGVSGPFWSRLAPSDAAALKRAVGQAAKSFGTTSVLGLLRDKSFVLTSVLREPASFERAVPELTRALRLPAVREPLAPLLGKLDPRETQTKFDGLDSPLHRLSVARATPREKGSEWWWGIRAGTLLLAGAPDPSATFSKLVKALPADTLAQSAALIAMAGRRSPSALALYADLSLLAAAPAPAPVLFTYGRREKSMRLELELSNAAASSVLARVGAR